MLNGNGQRMTLCGILQKISESSSDQDIKLMVDEATVMAKKMDAKLKEYSVKARRAAQSLAQDNWQ